MEIAIYRARIGLFYGALRIPCSRAALRNLSFKRMPLTSGLIIVLLLLLSGNVELNPGPANSPPRNSEHRNSQYHSKDESDMETHESSSPEFKFTDPIMTDSGAIGTVLLELRALSRKVDKFQDNIESWKNSIDKKVTDIKETQQTLVAENSELRKSVNSLQGQVNELENSSRANNLLFSGVVVDANRSPIDALRNFMTEELELPDAHSIRINGAFRLKDGRIIGKFAFWPDRSRIFETAKARAAGRPWRVKADICRAWQLARKKLAPFYSKLVAEGYEVSVKKDFILVDGKRFNYDPAKNEIIPHVNNSTTGSSSNGNGK